MNPQDGRYEAGKKSLHRNAHGPLASDGTFFGNSLKWNLISKINQATTNIKIVELETKRRSEKEKKWHEKS
jgi:hypothetical protein